VSERRLQSVRGVEIWGYVPSADHGCRRDPIDIQVATYDAIRRKLRAARESLLLTIRDVEEISGIASDLPAKLEEDQNPRMPPAQMLSEWAGALGVRGRTAPRASQSSGNPHNHGHARQNCGKIQAQHDGNETPRQ